MLIFSCYGQIIYLIAHAMILSDAIVHLWTKQVSSTISYSTTSTREHNSSGHINALLILNFVNDSWQFLWNIFSHTSFFEVSVGYSRSFLPRERISQHCLFSRPDGSSFFPRICRFHQISYLVFLVPEPRGTTGPLASIFYSPLFTSQLLS